LLLTLWLLLLSLLLLFGPSRCCLLLHGHLLQD
jgi:hypothetical protein